MLETTFVPVDAVTVGERKRPLNLEKVSSLQASIAEIGLLQPIVVTDRYRLVAGRHRLEAARRLGWRTIPARVAPLDDLRAELAEIDENLLRAELTFLQQGEHLARRSEILEVLGERARVGSQPGNQKAAKNKGADSAPLFQTTTDLAAEAGISKRSAQERLQVARNLSPDVKEAIAATPLADRATDLLDLARLGPEEQRQVTAVEGVKEGKTTVRAAARRVAARQRRAAPVRPPATDIYLYRGDALDAMGGLADGSVALVIADPPYNTTSHAWDRIGTDAAYLAWTRCWLATLRPKLAAGYHLFLFCDPDYAAAVEMALREDGWPLKSRIIWEYRNLTKGRTANDKFIENWQMCFHYGAHPLNFPDEWDDRRFMVQNHARPQSNFEEGSYHPTPKPVALLKILVEFGSQEDDLVLDPFAGGGSSGEACRQVGGRRCVLIEREDGFCRAIEARLGVVAHAL